MRYLKIAMTAALIGTSLGGLPQVASAAPAQAAKSDPVAEITALEREMEGLYNSPEFPKNPAIMHRFLSPDMTLIDIMQPGRFQGAATLKHADEVGVSFLGKVTFQNLNVQADANLGYVEYIQYFVGKTPAGQPFEMNLYTTDIWRKVDGKWLMVHQHVTLPMDQATLVQVMAPKKQ